MFEMDDNDIAQCRRVVDRGKETFSSIYLTSIGIIQNVALSILAWQLFQSSKIWERGGEDIVTIIAQSVVYFMAVLVVSTEYGWFVFIFRDRTKHLDIIVPYSLGFLEFVPAFQVTESEKGAWWLSMACFAFGGICAYIHTLHKYKTLEKGIVRTLVMKTVWKNIGIGVAAITIFLLVFIHYALTPRYIAWISCAIVMCGLVALMISSNKFLDTIEKIAVVSWKNDDPA